MLGDRQWYETLLEAYGQHVADSVRFSRDPFPFDAWAIDRTWVDFVRTGRIAGHLQPFSRDDWATANFPSIAGNRGGFGSMVLARRLVGAQMLVQQVLADLAAWDPVMGATVAAYLKNGRKVNVPVQAKVFVCNWSRRAACLDGARVMVPEFERSPYARATEPTVLPPLQPEANEESFARTHTAPATAANAVPLHVHTRTRTRRRTHAPPVRVIPPSPVEEPPAVPSAGFGPLVLSPNFQPNTQPASLCRDCSAQCRSDRCRRCSMKHTKSERVSEGQRESIRLEGRRLARLAHATYESSVGPVPATNGHHANGHSNGHAPRARVCDRPGCGGLLGDWYDGDMICVICGKVAYATAALPHVHSGALRRGTPRSTTRRSPQSARIGP